MRSRIAQRLRRVSVILAPLLPVLIAAAASASAGKAAIALARLASKRALIARG